jgi:hypothetical protein
MAAEREAPTEERDYYEVLGAEPSATTVELRAAFRDAVLRHHPDRATASQLARDGRLAVVDALKVDSPKTKLLAAKLKAMGLDSVLVIADTVDENLALASRNLANVLVVEPRYADPLSLVFYKKVLITKGAIEQLKEMYA